MKLFTSSILPAVCTVLLLLLSSCAKKQTLVILVEDPHNDTGSLEVRTRGGTQVLDQPYQATRIKGAAKPPTLPETMDREAVQTLFKEALDILPQKPVHFILYFHTDSTRLRKSSKQLLPDIVATINKRESKDISITGHTDRIAPESYNMALSYKRALFINHYLVSQNIAPDFLEITYHGESNPIVETPDEVAEPKNRRVEVIVR